MREQFLAGAEVVVAAVADTRVGEAWERPSVLDDQTIGSLAGHLARGFGLGGRRLPRTSGA